LRERQTCRDVGGKGDAFIKERLVERGAQGKSEQRKNKNGGKRPGIKPAQI